MRDQRTLFDLTQDGLVIGKKIQRIHPEFNVSGFVADVRTEMEEKPVSVGTGSSWRSTATYSVVSILK